MEAENNGSVPNVVVKTRLQLGADLGKKITQEDFGEWLTDGLVNVSLSRGSVSAWENGKYEPDTDMLLILAARYYGTADMRFHFAVDCLKAKLPEVFDSGIIEFRLPLAS